MPDLKLILAGLAALGVLVAGYSVYEWGYRNAANACAAEKAESLRNAIAQANEVAALDKEVLEAHAASQERTRTAFQRIRKGVIRYAENPAGRGVCLDPDGLRLWRAANAGVEPDTAARPFDPLPGPAPAR